MRILMLSNRFIFTNDMPRMLADLIVRGWDYDEMACKISEAYHKAAQDNNALIADVGRRFYELSDTQDLYAADGVHPNEAETIAAVIQKHKENQL